MDELRPMRFVEAGEQRPHDANGRLERHEFPGVELGGHPRAQRAARHVLHGEVRLPVDLSHVVHAHDVLVGDAPGGHALADQALHGVVAAHQVRVQQLEHDLLAAHRVLREVDDTHTALADEREHFVALREHGALLQHVAGALAHGRHGVLSREGRKAGRGPGRVPAFGTEGVALGHASPAFLAGHDLDPRRQAGTAGVRVIVTCSTVSKACVKVTRSASFSG